jgi:hypothetical protein
MKKFAIVLLVSAFAVPVFAQEARSAENGFMIDPFNHPLFPFYVVLSLMLVSMILVTVVAIYAIRILNLITEYVQKEKAQKLGLVYSVHRSGWVVATLLAKNECLCTF